MQDKQDELAGAVQEVLPRVHILVSDGFYREASEQIAAAVRAYLGSDEVVERTTRAIADSLASSHVYVSEDLSNCLVDGGLFDLRDAARAALSAAGGGHGE